MAEYLDREEVIERINKLFTKNGDGSIAKNDYNNAINAAKTEIVFSAVVTDVQPVKKGRWIDCTFYDPCEKSYEQNFEYKCSYCGHIINNKPNDDNWYCGHCGTIMMREG